MALQVGDQLGPYEILSPIGVGGMGEVYKGRDPRLDRIVAIKTSKTEFSERFEREARAVAALNHPNVCQIYDVGPNYLVMEFVDGAAIAPPDSPRKLLDMAVQISEGLAAAHAAGIVHRDLKPDNILMTREGRIKILDFGLAKAAIAETGPDGATRTVAANITSPGTTVGTIAYMSPEQARGQIELMAQSDQFSLGLVLYELAGGKRAFVRGSAAEIMTAIIREEAAPLPSSVPAPFRWIVERLLHKEPSERYDSTRDLYRELRQVRDRLSESVSAVAIAASSLAPADVSKRPWPTWAMLGAGLLLGAGLVGVLLPLALPPSGPDPSGFKFTEIAAEEATESEPAWSPDGNSIAYTININGVPQVFTKALGSREAAQLTNSPPGCWTPRWSRDGSTIYCSSGDSLWAVGAAGGKPTLAWKKVQQVALHPDGRTILFSRDRKKWKAPLQGGQPEEVTSLANFNDGRLEMKFSPDGSQLAVVALGDLWILDWPNGKPRNLGKCSSASWLPDNRRMLISSIEQMKALWILDTANGSQRLLYSGMLDLIQPSVSPDGKTIAFGAGLFDWDVVEVSITQGRVQAVVGGPDVTIGADWAPDGQHYLIGRYGASPHRVFIEDRSATAGLSRQVSEFANGNALALVWPRWAPDGKRFVYTEGTSGQTTSLVLANTSGGRGTRLIDGVVAAQTAWSQDGEWVAFARVQNGRPQLMKMRPVAGSTPVALGEAGTFGPDWSPTGEWIAHSSKGGVGLISPDGTQFRQLTTRRLSFFAFSKDGKQLYGIFRNDSGSGDKWQLYSVDVKSGAEKMITGIDLPRYIDRVGGFSLHPDGKRFITSIAKYPHDIWTLEGWEQPQKTWMDRLLRR